MQRVGSCSASRVGFGSLTVVFTNDDLKMDSADTAAVVLSFAISAAALAVRLMDRLARARGAETCSSCAVKVKGRGTMEA